ncbi:MAG TPA: amidase [Gemmatimonadota bacterium]|nr:amidase [Gemmatimonadota bacterium]
MISAGGAADPHVSARAGEGIPDLPAVEIRRRIAGGELSPVEVIESYLERLQALNTVLNAVVTLNERALDDARTLEREVARGAEPGLLHGLPVGIKDVTPVAGLRTTYGSRLYADHVPDEDALVVRRLRAAGAVILGKTNTPEFAAGGNTWNEVFGRTRNPWNPSRSAGGSTGGGAAALATGMIALAEGTDLGGSLRIPASFCGVVGLRPSVGLVPTHPTDWLWDTLQVTGPMARTAADVALMLQAVSGPDPRSPHAQPVTGRDFVAAVASGPDRALRLAYAPDPVGIGIDPGIEQVCRQAAFALEGAGHAVEEVALDVAYGRAAYLALRGLWFVTHLHPRLDRADEFGLNVRNNIRMGLETTTESLSAAEQARNRIWEEFRELFGRFDHLLTPCMAVSPFPVEQNYPETVAGRVMETYVDWIAPTFVLSLTGLPVASVPCGLDDEGLPVGLQIVGRPLGEEAVLALAAQVQAANTIGRPDLAAISAFNVAR